jgi:hypothetical protein
VRSATLSDVTDRLCVYCGSSPGASPAFATAAAELGTELAARGIGLVYGGASVGLMGVVADAVHAGGGETIGIMTEQLVGAEIAHTGLTRLEIVATMHDRKARMAELADGFVVLPGGLGTLDEAFEILTWNQLGLMRAPVVLLDVAGYFAHLFAFLDDAVAARLLKPEHRASVRRATAVGEAVDLACRAPEPTATKWIDRGAV